MRRVRAEYMALQLPQPARRGARAQPQHRRARAQQVRARVARALLGARRGRRALAPREPRGVCWKIGAVCRARGRRAPRAEPALRAVPAPARAARVRAAGVLLVLSVRTRSKHALCTSPDAYCERENLDKNNHVFSGAQGDRHRLQPSPCQRLFCMPMCSESAGRKRVSATLFCAEFYSKTFIHAHTQCVQICVVKLG